MLRWARRASLGSAVVFRRLSIVVAVSSLVALGLLLGSLLAAGGAGRVAGTADRTTAAMARSQSSPSRPQAPPPYLSVVADAKTRSVLVYEKPGRGDAWRRYANPTRQRTPLVFLVRARRGGWLRVLLPSRPNGSEGWILASQVELRVDPYSLRVDLRARRLIVERDARRVLDVAVGVGRAATPTPPGLYYVAELLRQPNPRGVYGPWAFALSAHSPVLTRFGGGDGQVGLHGTSDPLGIGHDVSHGCVRVRNSVIRRLAAILPLGTPVRIVSGREFTRT